MSFTDVDLARLLAALAVPSSGMPAAALSPVAVRGDSGSCRWESNQVSA